MRILRAFTGMVVALLADLSQAVPALRLPPVVKCIVNEFTKRPHATIVQGAATGLAFGLVLLAMAVLGNALAIPGALLAFPVLAIPEGVKRLQKALGKASDEQAAMLDALEEAGENPADNEDYQAKKAEVASIEAQIEERQAVEERRERLAQPTTEPEGPAPESRRVEVGADREAEQGFGSVGEQLKAVAAAAHPHRPTIDKRLLRIHEEARAASGLSEAVPSDGGFLVQKDFLPGIINRAYEIGQILSRVRRLPIGPSSNGIKLNAVDESSRADGSRWGGVQAYWADEAEQFTQSKPKFRKMEMALQKLIGLVYATDELLEDAAALGGVTQEVLPEELRFKAEDAIINGSGAGKPLGITQSGALVTVDKAGSQAADTFIGENASAMKARMWSRSRNSPSAVWLVNQDLEPQLDKIHYVIENKAASENVGGFVAPIYVPAGARGNDFALLHGKPVIPVEYCATLGDLGDILFVDLLEYLFIAKGGIRGEASMHVRFLYDEMTFRFVWRVEGQPAWNKPVTPKNGTNTLSPFVTLEART